MKAGAQALCKQNKNIARKGTMKRLLAAGVGFVAVSLLPVAGQAQDTVKIGLIMAFSGQFRSVHSD